MSTTAGAALPSALDDWLERLRLIPDAVRVFDVDLHAAQQTFGIDSQLAHELIARGLAHEQAADGPRFCTTDLHYVGLRLDTAMTHRTAMRLWAAALQDADAREETHVEVRCSPYGRPGDEVDVLVPPGTWERATIAPNRRATSFEVRTPSRWPPFDPRLHDLIHDVASLDFCLMPPGLYGDAEFVRATRLADCGSAAFLLAEECERLGVEARTSFGLLLSRPYATQHHWTDIRSGDTWIPADPLLLALLAWTTEIDATAWPPTRSAGSVLARLTDRQVPVARSAATGDPLEASFLVKLRESA